MPPSRIWKIILGVVLFIAALLLVEVALRAYGVDPSTDRMVAYQFDDTLGWKPRSDFKYYRSSLYYGQFNYYNPEGFPTDKAHWKMSASTTQDSIAMLGSSFAESYYVPYEQSYPYLIAKGSDKQVLNLGVSGYAPPQYLLRARTELSRYSVSDIVVIFFPFNDLPGLDSDEYQGYGKPYFGTTFDKPVNTPLSPPPPSKEEEGLVSQVRHTAIYTLLRPVIRKAIAINLKTNTKGPRTYDPEAMGKAMRLFTTLAKENPEARLLIYQVPNYKELSVPGLYEANLAVYTEACERYELRCLSADPIIAKHPNTDEIFITGDGHFTAYGTKLVADQLTEALRATSTSPVY